MFFLSLFCQASGAIPSTVVAKTSSIVLHSLVVVIAPFLLCVVNCVSALSSLYLPFLVGWY
jgi:hypothetical protein